MQQHGSKNRTLLKAFSWPGFGQDCGQKIKLWKPSGAVSDVTLRDLLAEGTFLAMQKEIRGLTAVGAGQVLAENVERVASASLAHKVGYQRERESSGRFARQNRRQRLCKSCENTRAAWQLFFTART